MTDILYKEEVFNIIGACMEVHNELGNGFLEAIYQEALEKELNYRKIPNNREMQLKVNYKNYELNKTYFADFICYNKIIIELKAVSELNNNHEAHLFNYLKATRMNLGLLVNFGEPSLNFRRIICTTQKYSNFN